MLNFWWFVLITITNTPHISVLARTQREILSLDLNSGNDAQISPRRQQLIQLLTELIQKHMPPGLWTRGDGALATSLSRDGTSWHSSNTRDEVDTNIDSKGEEELQSNIQKTIGYRDGVIKNRLNTKLDLNGRARPFTSNDSSSRSRIADQKAHRRDGRRKLFVKMRNGQRIEIKSNSNTNPIPTIVRKKPSRHSLVQPGEDCNEDSIVDHRKHFDDNDNVGIVDPNFGNKDEWNDENTSNDSGYPEDDTAQNYPDDKGYDNGDSRPTYNRGSYSACATTAYAINLIQSWNREMLEKQQLHSSNVENPLEYADYDDEIPSSRRRPKPPSWLTSMRLRGQLSAPMAGYTETYSLWYDADNGESRLEFNGGKTVMLRLRTFNGLYKLLGMQYTARSDGSTRRVCRVANDMEMSFADITPTALPDMSQFTFQGFVKPDQESRTSDKRIEHWQFINDEVVIATKTACAERLTYRHDILIERRQNGSVPLRYSVQIDSSILGTKSDVYVHTYHEVELAAPSPNRFYFDEKAECELYEEVNAVDLEQYVTYFDPLREFKSLTRGSLYSDGILIDRYKERFSRTYNDKTEEVLRKNILIQNNRFVSAVNRRGKSFTLEVNSFADLLKDEMKDQLLGSINYQHSGPIAPWLSFPYSRSSFPEWEKSLPIEFDWRDRGWSSRVYAQSPCKTCWAYAVTGSIEGGVFARTQRNIDLSEQSLIDCGHWVGARNCNSTWPFYAYEFVRKYGLPESEKYGPTIAKVGDCKYHDVAPEVHISGHVNVTAKSILALKIAIYDNGPVVVLIDASSESFLFVKDGVGDSQDCGREASQTNHAVLAVGWGLTSTNRTYFTVKNSWGTDWGENGYGKLPGNNGCGILTRPSYPLFPRDAA